MQPDIHGIDSAHQPNLVRKGFFLCGQIYYDTDAFQMILGFANYNHNVSDMEGIVFLKIEKLFSVQRCSPSQFLEVSVNGFWTSGARNFKFMIMIDIVWSAVLQKPFI